jgi:hypothetical protein
MVAGFPVLVWLRQSRMLRQQNEDALRAAEDIALAPKKAPSPRERVLGGLRSGQNPGPDNQRVQAVLMHSLHGPVVVLKVVPTRRGVVAGRFKAGSAITPRSGLSGTFPLHVKAAIPWRVLHNAVGPYIIRTATQYTEL